MYKKLIFLFSSYARKLRVNCPASILFSVVSQTQKYSTFIPWCVSSEIISKKSKDENETRLMIEFTSLYSLSYVSKVKIVQTQESYVVQSTCKEDPLQYLESIWVIYKNNSQVTIADYQVKYKFLSPIYEKFSNLFLNYVGEEMCQTFINQALQQHQFFQKHHSNQQNIQPKSILQKYLQKNSEIEQIYKENKQFSKRVNQIARKLKNTIDQQSKIDFQIRNLMLHMNIF